MGNTPLNFPMENFSEISDHAELADTFFLAFLIAVVSVFVSVVFFHKRFNLKNVYFFIKSSIHGVSSLYNSSFLMTISHYFQLEIFMVSVGIVLVALVQAWVITEGADALSIPDNR